MKPTCQHPNCELQPTFGIIWKTPMFCKNHKTNNLINVVSKRCINENCDLQPSYGYFWKKPISCFKHKNEKMTNVNNKKCERDTCDKSASFGEIWMKPLRCHEHKLINDKNVTHKSCKTELCETIGNPKYKGYCLRCFINIFPNEKISRNFKIKEQHLVDSIKQNFLNEKMIIDKIVDGGCSRRRPDIVIDKYTHVIIIECDENQHNQKFYTECDNKRLMELFQDFGSRPLVMIKFNPDKYIDKFLVKHSSCFSNHKGFDVPLLKTDEFNKRIEKLNKLLGYTIATIPDKEITIHHLFYDENIE
jgi:Holliday junction resolvase